MVLSSTFLSPFYMVAIITSLTSCNQRRTIYAKHYVVIYNRLCFIEKLKRSSKNSHSLLLISHLLLMILLLSLDTKLLFLSLRKFI
jgi:hypothetical protein